MVLGGGSIGNGAVTSTLGNVSTVTMYIALQGQYTIARSSLGQPSHDNPACGPLSLDPFFDCITYSGTGGSVFFQAVDVDLVGWSDRTTANPGNLVKFDVAPSPGKVGGINVSTDALEWQWVPDDQAIAGWNPPCSRHCEIVVRNSGTMYARAYTNGTMKVVNVAHIQLPPGPCDFPGDVVPDPITHDAGVQNSFRNLWEQSNPTANLAQRLELGAWITRVDGITQIVPWSTALPFCGGDLTLDPPPGTIGFVHTHPYSLNEIILACGANGRISSAAPYPGEPSDPDRQTAASIGQRVGVPALPGYILDANGVIRFFANAPDVTDRTPQRCGY